jgi:hypothetical protein
MFQVTDLPSKEIMAGIMEAELKLLSTKELKYFKTINIPTQLKSLCWEYGNGETYEAWVFADFKERDVGAAYCLGGFGSMGSPWGLIFLADDNFGMDCGWYSSLKDMLNDGWLDGDS